MPKKKAGKKKSAPKKKKSSKKLSKSKSKDSLKEEEKPAEAPPVDQGKSPFPGNCIYHNKPLTYYCETCEEFLKLI
jgi:hypothetical protein